MLSRLSKRTQVKAFQRQNDLFRGSKLSKIAFSTSFALKRPFCTRVIHNDKFDELYQDIRTNDTIQKAQLEIEQTESKEFYQRFSDFDIYYDIRDEIQNRTISARAEVPEVMGDYEYFSVMVFDKGNSSYALKRKPLRGDKPATTIFNPLQDRIIPSPYLSSFTMEEMSLSMDQQTLGVCIDIMNNELPVGFIKSLKENRMMADRLAGFYR